MVAVGACSRSPTLFTRPAVPAVHSVEALLKAMEWHCDDAVAQEMGCLALAGLVQSPV